MEPILKLLSVYHEGNDTDFPDYVQFNIQSSAAISPKLFNLKNGYYDYILRKNDEDSYYLSFSNGDEEYIISEMSLGQAEELYGFLESKAFTRKDIIGAEELPNYNMQFADLDTEFETNSKNYRNTKSHGFTLSVLANPDFVNLVVKQGRTENKFYEKLLRFDNRDDQTIALDDPDALADFVNGLNDRQKGKLSNEVANLNEKQNELGKFSRLMEGLPFEIDFTLGNNVPEQGNDCNCNVVTAPITEVMNRARTSIERF
jgi:hypothetical protein